MRMLRSGGIGQDNITIKSSGLKGEVAEVVTGLLGGRRRRHVVVHQRGTLILGLDYHVAHLVIIERLVTEYVPQLYSVPGKSTLQVCYLVLEPLLLVAPTLLLLLKRLLQFAQALLRGQVCLAIKLILSLEPLDQRLLVLVVRAPLGISLASRPPPILHSILPLKLSLPIPVLVVGYGQSGPVGNGRFEPSVRVQCGEDGGKAVLRLNLVIMFAAFGFVGGLGLALRFALPLLLGLEMLAGFNVLQDYALAELGMFVCNGRRGDGFVLKFPVHAKIIQSANQSGWPGRFAANWLVLQQRGFRQQLIHTTNIQIVLI